jgi:NitT/TauT family transport system substrate-binding protein
MKKLLIVAFALCCVFGGVLNASAEKLRIGHLRTLAVDAQMVIAIEKGYFKAEGLEVETTKFTSGVPLMQALTGNSVDVAAMGAVICNFPAQGQGKVFLTNAIEWDTAQLYARPETKATKITDIKNGKVATVKGTTAHVFLHEAMKANGMDSTKDVELVSMDMAGAVAAFISGAVPYVVTWAPFEVRIMERVKDAKLISSAKDFYPQAAIMSGWVASNKFYAGNKATLKKIIRAWQKANDDLIANPQENLKLIHAKAYSDIPYSDIEVSWNREKCYTAAEWRKLYQDGSVVRWLGQVNKVFVEIGSLPKVTDPKEFFDSSLFLETIK